MKVSCRGNEPYCGGTEVESLRPRLLWAVNGLLRLLRSLTSTGSPAAPILDTNQQGMPGNYSATPAELGNAMDRRELLLAVLATAKGRPFQPAQIQKAIFLIEKNMPHLVHRGPHFNFVPYNYGPFDRNVYVEAEALQHEGKAVIAASENGRWNTYAASDEGIRDGELTLERLKKKTQRYINSVVEWVLAQSFGSLVKSIYDAYPEMKENSIFQG